MRTYLIFGAAILLTAINGLMLTRHFVQYLDRGLVGEVALEVGLGMPCATVMDALDRVDELQSDRDWITSVIGRAYMNGAIIADETVALEPYQFCAKNPFAPFLDALRQ